MLYPVWHPSAESKLHKINRKAIDVKDEVFEKLKDSIKQQN